MKKLGEVKEAIANTPPERLAKIEYQSHFMQMLGVSIVCVILVLKGLWYIIFAFIFSLGISYSQGMGAYRKYRNIMAIIKPEEVSEYEKDISPTRRRGKIIDHVYGSKAKWFSIIIAVMFSYLLIGFDHVWYLQNIAYFISIVVIYILLYYFVTFWFAYHYYKKEIKLK